MKTFKKLVVLVLAVMLSAFCFTAMACKDNTSVSGKTYAFYQLTMNAEGMNVNVKVGESFMGSVLDESYMIINFKEDGTVDFSSMGENMEGTWVQNGQSLTITIDNEPQTFTISGNKITMSQTEEDPDMGAFSMTVVLQEYTQTESNSSTPESNA